MTDPSQPQPEPHADPPPEVEPQVIVDLDQPTDDDEIRGGCMRTLQGGCTNTRPV